MPGPKIPTDEEVAYMMAHADDDIRANLIACSVTCAVLATIFVSFRLSSRRINHGRLQLDASDWLTIVAFILYLPFSVVVALITRYGAGQHIIFVTDARMLQILILIDENLYACIMALLKWSILSLYRTIFGSTQWMYRLTWAVTVFVGCLALQVILSTNLQCIPISYTWNPVGEGTCINYGLEALVAYVFNIVTDLVIVTMPIPLVLHLQASKSKKRGLLIVFCAGGAACVVSIVQLAFVTKLGTSSDGSWDNMPSVFLGDVEIMVGFLATSIATYRPLYRLIFNGGMRSSAGYSRQKKSGISDSTSRQQQSHQYSHQHSHSHHQSHHQYSQEQSHTARIFGTGKYPLPDDASGESRCGITVTNEIELETSHHGVPPHREREQW